MADLVLLTTNHPFTHTGGETMFVGPELPALAAAFDRVSVVPLHARGARLPLPAGVTLDATLAEDWRRRRAWYTLTAPAWPGFAREFARGWRQGGWVGAVRVWRWAAVARACWRWLQRRGEAGPLLYTYWRGGQTLAATRWAAAHPACRVVTRVHGYDLYAQAFSPPFQPWEAVYAPLDRVLAVSRHGVDHLRSLGLPAERLELARLGVAASRARSRASADGVWRVVSCSHLIPLKRVDRIARALVQLARQHPDRRLAWTHFGDGPQAASVRAALREAPPNLSTRLAGRVDNETVLAHYAQEPVDLFVLLSRSEGLPVSIQEALAAGVPVLATDVGGVAEAVGRDGEAGLLLPADADDAAVLRALQALLGEEDPARRTARREAARQRWAQDFDAARNHTRLARTLRSLLSPRS